MAKWDNEANETLRVIVTDLQLTNTQADELRKEINRWADSVGNDADQVVTRVKNRGIRVIKTGGWIVEILGAR